TWNRREEEPTSSNEARLNQVSCRNRGFARNALRSRPSAKRFQATAASALAVALPSAVANAANPSPRPGNRVRDARLRTRQTQGFVPLQAASNLGALRRAHGCQGNIEIYLFMFKSVSRLLFKA